MAALGVNTKCAGAGGGTAWSSPSVTTQATGSSILVGQMCTSGATPGAPTDNYGNTYTAMVSDQVNATQGFRVQVFKSENILGGSGHQWNGLFADRFTAMSVYIVELVSVALSSILDVSAQGNQANNWNTSGASMPITPAIANDIILHFIRGNTNGGVMTANGGFTKLDFGASSSDTAVLYRNVTTATTYDPLPTDTASNDSAWIAVAIKNGGATNTTITPQTA